MTALLKDADISCQNWYVQNYIVEIVRKRLLTDVSDVVHSYKL